MSPELLDVGVAGVVVLLVLDKVIALVQHSRSKNGGKRQELMGQLVEAVHVMSDAVKVKNAVDVRLENHQSEIDRLRDSVHGIRRDIQDYLNHKKD